MQSYPLHTHNVVLFLVSSWKQTFGVRRVVSVADRTWENIDLTFSSLWVRHSILITSTFGNCYDDSLHLGIINAPFTLLQRTTIIAFLTLFLPLSWFFRVKSNPQEKRIKFALQNSLMHDTDEHYFHVRHPHDRRMEYVWKTGWRDILTCMMYKV